jgi:threonine dehydrogenase-like Zn-dependent dehydrogenase
VPPLIMGHEISGVVAGGDLRNGLHAGQRVVVNPLITCGECEACRSGVPNLCPTRQLVGLNRPGGFAEYVAVPATALVPLPDQLDDTAASLAEPLAVGVRAAQLTGRTAGPLLIAGAGSIGLLCLQAAQALGFAPIGVTDIDAGRLRVAADLGAAQTYNLREAGVAEELAAGAQVNYPAAVDAVGVPATRRLTVDVLGPAGTAVWVGSAEDEATINGNNIVRQERHVRGSYGYTPDDFSTALQLLATGRIAVEKMVQEFPLEQGPEVFMRLLQERGSVVKAVLVP